MRIPRVMFALATVARAVTVAVEFTAANNGTCNLVAENAAREPLWLPDDWPAYECSCSCAKSACQDVFPDPDDYYTCLQTYAFAEGDPATLLQFTNCFISSPCFGTPGGGVKALLRKLSAGA